MCGYSGVKPHVDRVISMTKEESLTGVSPSTWDYLIQCVGFQRLGRWECKQTEWLLEIQAKLQYLDL